MYSWGQIRLLLQQWAGSGVSLDAIDHAINSTYSLILARLEWQDLEVKSALQSVAGYDTGSIAITQGSNLVTGTGTAWTSAMNGLQLFLTTCGGTEYYTVTITSPTTLTLDRPLDSETNGSAGYWLAQAIYQLPDNCRSLVDITSPETGLALDPLTQAEFDATVGTFLLGGPTTNYIPQPPGVNGQTGNIVQQVMLWPIPVRVKSYVVSYKANANAFNGSNVTDGPLPFVSDGAMVAGAKAALSKGAERMDYKAEFEDHFAGMVRVETSKQPPKQLAMQDGYVRHRISRLIRNSGGIYRRDCF